MSGIAFVVKCENILASLYVTRKRSHLMFAQSSVTGLYGVRHSPLLLLTLAGTLSKVLERVLYDQNASRFNEYIQLADISSIRISLRLFHTRCDNWLKAIDQGENTEAVFLELAKAFNSVDHAM